MAPPSSDTNRLLALLIAGMLVAACGVVWLQGGSGSTRAAAASAIDNPLQAATPIPIPSTSSTSTAPTTTPPPVVQQKAPIDVPADPYANEPIQMIGQIEIPKIGLVQQIYHGITLRNIDNGPSHWPGTAFPGENGNAVFAGHRVTHTHPFLRIDELGPGDQVIFTVQGHRSVYIVTGHEVVTPKQTEIVNQTATPTATLFACHPPHSAAYRYVVHLALSA